MVFNPEKINRRLPGKETVIVLISPLLMFNDTVPEEPGEPDKTQVQFITYTYYILLSCKGHGGSYQVL